MSKNPPGVKATHPKVIFADFAIVKFQSVVQMLEAAHIPCETSTVVSHLITRVSETPFELCVINLLLGGIGPYELIENIRKNSCNPNLKIIVVTRQVHKLNIQNTMRAGANDFIAEPFQPMNLYNRIVYHLGQVQVIEPTNFATAEVSPDSEFMKLLLEAGELLSHTNRDQIHAATYTVLSRIAGLLNSNRTSLIIVDAENNAGVVLATSDDPKFYNFPVALDNYPEILHVIHSGGVIFVEDVKQNALTSNISSKVKTIAIGSLMAFPVSHQGEMVGVLLVRRPQATEIPKPETMRILQGIANLMAAHSNVAVLLRRIYKGYMGSSAA